MYQLPGLPTKDLQIQKLNRPDVSVSIKVYFGGGIGTKRSQTKVPGNNPKITMRDERERAWYTEVKCGKMQNSDGIVKRIVILLNNVCKLHYTAKQTKKNPYST